MDDDEQPKLEQKVFVEPSLRQEALARKVPSSVLNSNMGVYIPAWASTSRSAVASKAPKMTVKSSASPKSQKIASPNFQLTVRNETQTSVPLPPRAGPNEANSAVQYNGISL